MTDNTQFQSWYLTVPAMRGFIIHIRSILPHADPHFVEGLLQQVFQRPEIYDAVFDALDDECSTAAALLGSPLKVEAPTVYPTEEE